MIFHRIVEKLKENWKLLISPLFFFLLDLIYRFQQLKEFESSQLTFYCISVCLSFSYFIFIFLLLRSIVHKKWLFYLLYFLIGPLWLFSFFGSFQFESMNGIFPNYHTFLFIREEPYSAWTLATYTLNL